MRSPNSSSNEKQGLEGPKGGAPKTKGASPFLVHGNRSPQSCLRARELVSEVVSRQKSPATILRTHLYTYKSTYKLSRQKGPKTY